MRQSHGVMCGKRRPVRCFAVPFPVSQAIWLLFCIGQRLGIHRTLGWVKLSHTQFTQVSAERRLNTLRSFSAPTHSEMSDLIALWNFMSSVKSNGSLEDVSPFGSNTAIFGSARRVYHSEVLNARVI